MSGAIDEPEFIDGILHLIFDEDRQQVQILKLLRVLRHRIDLIEGALGVGMDDDGCFDGTDTTNCGTHPGYPSKATEVNAHEFN